MNLGYTGRMAEKELFDEAIETTGLELYLNYQQSLKAVKESQPWEDPSDPDKRFANDLHATIANKLGFEDYSKLKFYTSVNSHLDKYHGVDAFFELELDNGQKNRVTLDVTLNINKGEDWKADVVFQWPSEGLDPDLPEDKKEYIKQLEFIADRIVKLIKQ